MSTFTTFNNRYIPERHLLQAQISRTYSEGHLRVLRAARRLQSVRQPCALTRTRSYLWTVINCPPVYHQSTIARGKGCSARFRKVDNFLGKEGQADRNGRLGESNRFARECELVVDPDGRCWPRTREPINRDPREHCESDSARLGADIYVDVDVPSSSVQGYESEQVTSFSYIHASKPTGESARLNPSVCGLVDCSAK